MGTSFEGISFEGNAFEGLSYGKTRFGLLLPFRLTLPTVCKMDVHPKLNAPQKMI